MIDPSSTTPASARVAALDSAESVSPGVADEIALSTVAAEGPGKIQWIPVQEWAVAQTDETRALFSTDVWLSPAWAGSSRGVPTFLLVSTVEQEDQLRVLNDVLIAAQQAVVPVYGPSILREYVGDLLVLMDVDAQMRLAVAIARTGLEGTQLGARITTSTLQSNALLVPVWVGRMQGLMAVARELLGKSLLHCNDAELVQVHEGMDRLLLAVRAGGTLRAADMPRLPAPEPPPAPEKPQREPGQYL